MKSFKLSIHKIISEAVGIITSRQRLRRTISTPLYRNALYLLSSAVATSAFGFLFWIAVARFYSENEVGLSSATISAINLLAILSIAGLNFSIIRFLSRTDEPARLINSSFILSGLISLVAAAIFITIVDHGFPALSFIKQSPIYYLTFVVIVVFTTLSNLMDSVFVARRRAGFVLSKNITFSFLRIPIVIALAAIFHMFGVILSWGIALGVALAIAVFLFLPKVEAGYKLAPTLRLSHFKGIRKYAAKSYLASLLGRAPIMVLPLMVVNLLGTESNAYFYISWMIASMLFTIPGSVSRSLFAEGSHSEENVRKNIAKSIKFTFLLLVPAVVVLIVAGKWILFLFGPGYSAHGLALLWLLILASLPRGINNIYISFLRIQDRLKEVLIIRVSIAVSVLTLSFLFITEYGIIAIGFIWLGVQVVVAITLALRLVNWKSRFSQSKYVGWEDDNHL